MSTDIPYTAISSPINVFTGIGGSFDRAVYRYTLGTTQYLNPTSCYHQIIMDTVVNSNSELTLNLPQARAIPCSSRFWFLFLSQSNPGDVITFLPWDSTMTINQQVSYSFTCSGQKALFILALVPSGGNYICHALTASSHLGNIVPTEQYQVNPGWAGAAGFAYVSLDPTSLVSIIPDMSTYIRVLNPNPATGFPGFQCNVSGWYRVTPNIEMNISYTMAGGSGPSLFGLYIDSVTPFDDLLFWPTNSFDNGGNDFFGIAAGGCLVYLEAASTYYIGFNYDDTNVITTEFAGSLSFEYISSNGNTPAPAPLAPPAPSSVFGPSALSSVGRPPTPSSSRVRESVAPSSKGKSNASLRSNPSNRSSSSSQSSRGTALQDIELAVDAYLKSHGTEILSKINNVSDLQSMLGHIPPVKKPVEKRKRKISPVYSKSEGKQKEEDPEEHHHPSKKTKSSAAKSSSSSQPSGAVVSSTSYS